MPVGRPRLPPSDDPVVQAKRDKARAYAQEGRDKAKVRTAKAKAGATIAGAIKRKLATPKKKKVDDNRLHNLPEDLQRKIMKMAYVPPTKKELRIEYANNFHLYAPISFSWERIKDYLRDNHPQIVRRFYRKLGEDDYVEGEWIMYGKDRRGVILVLDTGDDTEPHISLRIRWRDMPYGMEEVFDAAVEEWKEAYDKNYGNSDSSDYGSSGGNLSGFPNISTPSLMSMGSLAGSYSGNLSGSSTPIKPKRKTYYNEYQQPLWSSSASSSDYSILTPITAHRRMVEKGYASKSSSRSSSAKTSSSSGSSGKVAGSRRIS